jgi:HrpA-like RNA helicase
VELQTTCGGGGAVGVQIRGDSTRVSAATRIKFMTDGILLQEIKKDFLLRK